MKKIKKLITVLLAGLMLLSLAACGAKEENVVKRGTLQQVDGAGLVQASEHEAHQKDQGISYERINYNNLSSALLDLENGKIDHLLLEKSFSNYVAARNDKIAVDTTNSKTNFSMLIMEDNKEVYDILNNTIVDMKADGTLDFLIENELTAYIESDPEAKDLPKFDGAKTIKVGVTGDLPPMDFVASNGKSAGFNIALLTEIANRAQLNIELVQIESGARAISLSSGKVDAVFWAKSATCDICNATGTENIEGAIITDSYFTDFVATIALKSAK